MFDNIKEVFRMFVKSRLAVATVVMVLLFGVLLWRVFFLQVVNGQEYQDNSILRIVKERTLNSTRGNIYDRNGNLLAYNELAYSITIEDNGTYSSTDAKNTALNAEIAQIITALEANGDSIINDFKVDLTENGSYEFNVTGTSWKRFLADVYGEVSYDNLEYDKRLGYDTSQATVEQVMEYLTDNCYGISEEYDTEMTYKICVVRFAMAQNAYQKYITTTIATNVSEESVAYIGEHSSELQGVEVLDDTIRKYNHSEYFASILGYTGKISSEEYAKLSETDESYTLNDIVGKGGIEQYMDAYLKGEKGYEKLYVDYMGKALEVIEREEPRAGANVYLSLDSELQIAVYDLLEQEIAGIVYSNIDNPSSDIPIPITDVYFALINNNVIDFTAFSDVDASPAEQSVLRIFESRQDAVKSQLSSQLNGTAAINFADLGEEEQDYFSYIIRRLKRNGILLESNIDTTDEVYQNWQQGTISPKDYLSHAISKNWIDITQFTVEEKYSDSTEIYDALCTYILEELFYENDFSKIIYEYLIKSDAISGTQLCLILFDQGVLPYDEDEIASLNNGSVTAVTFLKEKIRNLDITPAQLALDPCSGSCVVTDAKTGELLAMVSYPGYDSNRLANTVDAEYFNSLQDDKSLPQYNYATQQQTAPGSTFKMVTSTAGLSEGVITLGERIRDLGVYENISNHPRCWIFTSSGGTHGEINVSEALRDSCNYYYYEVGYRLATNNYTTSYSDELGISKIQKYAALFGLDERTGIEIEEAEPQIADSFPVMAAIGQSNNNYTTVQLARYVTAVANSGTVYEYTLLDHIEDADGNLLETYEPNVRNTVDVLNSEEWNAIHYGMRMVVENTSEFDGFPITAAGKTGTAQENPKRANHALFVGYAPYENPEISIATRIPYGYTSHNAAEVSRNVFAYYFGVEDEEELLSGQAEDVNSSSNQFSD
ncbi:MAG: peptidoglycan glycosyltransferase [Roseburia sp.]|nr:peptidoglycan glycosyltransferase [Roseburia sp.]